MYIFALKTSKMNFKRNIIQNLIEWKNTNNRKPLILRGARQVGKTTVIKEFAKTYRYTVILNLEKPEHLRYFKDYTDVKSIIEALFIEHQIPSASIGETLLFIDEIQESPEAIGLLRYFYEDVPELNVIAAGSLLEFAVRYVKNFPVGRVIFLYLFPLNFREYLEAIGHKTAIEQLDNIPVKNTAHTLLMNLFHRYVITGGMPEIIKTIVETGNLADLPPIYEALWNTYQNDIEKYAANEAERRVIKHIISTAHLSIDKRIKFQSFGNSNYRSREVSESFKNLDDAKIIQLIYPTTDTAIPIRPDHKKSPKIQFLDTGLLNHTLNIQPTLLAAKDLSIVYKGAIIPHLITQELISLNTTSYHKPNFWVREKKQSNSEVDLVYAYREKVIPIEIKSGASGTLKSLHQFMEECNHHFAVRIYGGKLAVEISQTTSGKKYLLLNIPYYLGTKIPEHITWFVDNHPLPKKTK